MKVSYYNPIKYINKISVIRKKSEFFEMYSSQRIQWTHTIKCDFYEEQGDWTNTEIRIKYEKLKLHDLFNRSMEIVFQKIQKWGI